MSSVDCGGRRVCWLLATSVDVGTCVGRCICGYEGVLVDVYVGGCVCRLFG